jgi:hypothetical protein
MAKEAAEKVMERRARLKPCRRVCDRRGLQPLRYGFSMIRGEFLCDHRTSALLYVTQMAKRRTPGAKALVAVVCYGTGKPVPFVQRVLPQPLKPCPSCRKFFRNLLSPGVLQTFSPGLSDWKSLCLGLVAHRFDGFHLRLGNLPRIGANHLARDLGFGRRTLLGPLLGRFVFRG